MFTLIIDGVKNALAAAVAAVKAVFDPIIRTISDAINKVVEGVRSITSKGTATRNNNARGNEMFGPGFAEGGKVSGPGTGTSDSIMARLSNGEFVMKAAAVRKYGAGFMHAINNGFVSLKGFAAGGMVDAAAAMSGFSSPNLQPAMASVSGNQTSGRPLNLIMPNGEVVRATTSESTAKKLEKDLRRADVSKTGKMPRWY